MKVIQCRGSQQDVYICSEMNYQTCSSFSNQMQVHKLEGSQGLKPFVILKMSLSDFRVVLAISEF